MSNDLAIFLVLASVFAFVWALADGTCTDTSFCSPFALEQMLR